MSDVADIVADIEEGELTRVKHCRFRGANRQADSRDIKISGIVSWSEGN